MNDKPADLARMLPAPIVPDLSADRHRDLKDAFMQTITEVPQAQPRPARRRWAMIAAPAAAFAVAAVAITAVTVSRQSSGPEGSAAPIIAVDPGSASGVAPLIDRLALAAGGSPSTPVGSGQFVYIRSKVAWLVFAEPMPEDGSQSMGEDPMILDKVHSREIWIPATAGSTGKIREHGDLFGLEGTRTNSFYAGWPTDPDALLRKVYTDTKGQGQNSDDQAFDEIGEALRESILPPEVAAALYRAAAKIPGVVLVKDSVDAAGRHGVAVAHTDIQGERREWIFDPDTFTYLGERSYLVRDTNVGKKGMLTGTTAVLERAVVDKAGKAPR
ncbi:CU044_5270 family protein [Actinoplanes sp. NBRC 103695]|uniref:CU044_5270 family protein n=1 Tax=Actinoplanes sp. NBRC 103695 TaxID=3032202 RepID=UPI0024A562AA|nr:CU044_5270 family protein [Actinoplanes sp. NBRC 103695]GLZ00478.1 hypothetical protein Acsp02_77300 [Actinoplanes sp. NBRC 103695]